MHRTGAAVSRGTSGHGDISALPALGTCPRAPSSRCHRQTRADLGKPGQELPRAPGDEPPTGCARQRLLSNLMENAVDKLLAMTEGGGDVCTFYSCY